MEKRVTHARKAFIYTLRYEKPKYCEITELKLFIERIYTINHVCVSRVRAKNRTRKCPNRIDRVLSWRVFTETIFMWLGYCAESMNDLMNKSLYGEVYFWWCFQVPIFVLYIKGHRWRRIGLLIVCENWLIFPCCVRLSIYRGNTKSRTENEFSYGRNRYK